MSLVTTDDLLDLRGINQRQSWFRFDILDRTLANIGNVQPDGTPTVSADASRAIMRSMTGFTLPPDAGADFEEVGTYIQPWMVLENGDSFALGTFRFVDARRIRSSLGITFEGTLGDLSVVVDVQSTNTFGVAAGTMIETVIAGILRDRGIVSYLIDTTGIIAGTPIGWPAGTSWLRIVNELAALMGCLPLYFEAEGRARVRLIPDLALTDPAVTYSDGLNIFETGIAEWNDLLTSYNQFVVIESGSTGAPIRGEYSVPPSAPNSSFHTGFDNPKVINEQGLQDATTATERARLASITDGTVFERVTFDGAPDPRHGAFDVIEFRGLRYLEGSWSLQCAEGAPMHHSLARIYS